MCMPDGIMFFGQTYFEFVGRVFARGRESNSKCVYTLSGTNAINASFSYTECGIPVTAKVSRLMILIFSSFAESIFSFALYRLAMPIFKSKWLYLTTKKIGCNHI